MFIVRVVDFEYAWVGNLDRPFKIVTPDSGREGNAKADQGGRSRTHEVVHVLPGI